MYKANFHIADDKDNKFLLVADVYGQYVALLTGTGKSHIAQAIGHEAIRKGLDVLLVTPTKLFAELQAAKALNSFLKKMTSLIKVPLLIIDDFGLKPLQPVQEEDFHDLISERYERATTIVTSNLAFSEWGDAFSNKLLGAATLDRLKHGSCKVILEGKSYRASKDYNANTKKSTEK